jgi:hypothetical protein
LVTETSTRITGLAGMLDQSFPGAVLSCPLVIDQWGIGLESGIYEHSVAYLLPFCYPQTKNGSRGEKTGPKQMAKWQPGESGNPKGRPPKRAFDEYLKQALTSKRGEKAKLLVDRLIVKATTGNVAALKLVCERVGGKPKTAEQVAPGNSEAVTLDQVRQKLAELLSNPDVRRTLQTMLGSSGAETIQ